MANQALLLGRMGCLERGTTTRSMAYETSIVAADIPVKIIIRNRRNFFSRRDNEEDKKNSTNKDNEGYGFFHTSLLPKDCGLASYDHTVPGLCSSLNGHFSKRSHFIPATSYIIADAGRER